MLKRLPRANVVNLAEPLPESIEGVGNACVRRLATTLVKDSEKKVTMLSERVAGWLLQGSHHRNICFQQLPGKLMFLSHLLFSPATGPVELGDHRRAFVQPYLVHAIFIAVQGKKAPTDCEAGFFHGIQKCVRSQGIVWMG